MRVVPACAAVVFALALYVSRGVLDQVLTPDGPVRVALLPPVQALTGFLGLGLLGLLWLNRQTVPRASATQVKAPVGPLVLPLFGLAVLLLPYLPIVGDALPALQAIAGPLRGVIWLAVLAQFAWVLWQSRIVGATWLARRTVGQLTAALVLAAATVSAIAAARLTATVLYPAGDEPHYLIIAQSLWRDGDLKIENNHQQRDYGEYFARDLDPHYLTRGRDGEIYSIHPVGLPVLLAPVYAAAGYRGVVTTILLAAAIAAALMWRMVVRATNAPGAATFAWAAIVLTAPFLYNSFAVYPEIAGALASTLAFTLAVRGPALATRRGWLAVGACCALLPWLSTKYAPMSAALVAIACVRILWPTRKSQAADVPALSMRAVPRTAAAVALVVAPYVASLLAWFSFFYAIWGTPWPQAPYGHMVQTDVKNLVFGAPGLIFDQEYGLLPYAPVYALAAGGLWRMWRDGGDARRQGIEIVLAFAALVGTVGAFRIWWGGSAAPGRPLTSGLLLLMLPMTIAFRDAAVASARRAAQHLLLWLSIGIAGVLLLAQDGFLTSNGRDGTSSLLEYLSPRWPAWTAVPSFIYHEPLTAWLSTGLWLALAAGAAIVLARVRASRAGAASLAAMAVCATALIAGAAIVPLVPVSPQWRPLVLEARARLPLLDEYDTTTRPIGIEYAPLRVTGAATVATHAALEVAAGTRTEPQPVRVLHNGRFSLPAGRYRIDVHWSGTRGPDTMGLQLGRTGEAWHEWKVEPRQGTSWSTEVTLPIDASFVGLRGSPELERSIGKIAIVPISVIDLTRRPKLPTFIGASDANGATFFYHDANALPEPPGFWVRGGRTTRTTFYRERADGPLRLRINSGPVENRLQVSTMGWSMSVTLAAKMPQEIEIPTPGRSLVTLELTTDREFVPNVLDPSSQDARPLGVWIEVLP
jgi:hypothetical protein